MKPTFFSSCLVLGRLRAIFEESNSVFPRSTVYFLSHSPILNPISGDFLMARHSFQPRTSIFPRFVQYFPILRTLLREIPPHYFLRTPFFTQRECFSDSCFPHSSRPASPSSPDLLPFRSSFPPPSSLPPPLSFSFLPTFPSSSPINARTRALSRITCVRVRPHTPTRQEVFIYCLHRFTHPSQSAVHQHIRCEGKQEKAFTKHSITSKSIH